MQRRTALKNIGLSLGALTLSSTVVGLFESCQTGTAAWQPEFLSLEQADLVNKIMDVILPTTENIPGAKDLNLTQFLDGYMAKVSSLEDKEFTLLGLPLVSKLMLEASGKSQVSELTSQDIDDQLNRFLRADPATKESRQNELNSWAEALENGEQISVPEEGVIQTMLNSIRDLSVFAFKNSELIGETVLAYRPVPGEQQGCISLSDATGGRAWSL
ncbi:MAG: gluconate 2-dehydrogenase subunit 3 family protein [Flavobacteriaceae bacterium]|nr:gluconate 2-dehydrogenase subunit 3 family protein [Flavobacteriaceae bacterium]